VKDTVWGWVGAGATLEVAGVVGTADWLGWADWLDRLDWLDRADGDVAGFEAPVQPLSATPATTSPAVQRRTRVAPGAVVIVNGIRKL
jgi:hypothetical protein